MGAAAEYFRNIKDAVLTIFDGMAVSASHLIRKPYTIQYPDRTPVRVQDTLPFRYRGILDVDMEICTGCLACERACPIDCIAIVCEKNAQTRELTISQFDIDVAKCMYCGLCSEPCPTGSIHHTTEFEGADFSLESLIRRFITDPVVAYKPKKGPEPDPHLGRMLERGMRFVEEWAQPGGDKPAAAAGAAQAKPAPPPTAARPAAPVAPAKPAPAATVAAAAGPLAADSGAGAAAATPAVAPAPPKDAAQPAAPAADAAAPQAPASAPTATAAGADAGKAPSAGTGAAGDSPAAPVPANPAADKDEPA